MQISVPLTSLILHYHFLLERGHLKDNCRIKRRGQDKTFYYGGGYNILQGLSNKSPFPHKKMNDPLFCAQFFVKKPALAMIEA